MPQPNAADGAAVVVYPRVIELKVGAGGHTLHVGDGRRSFGMIFESFDASVAKARSLMRDEWNLTCHNC